jgi:hypothetical protein
MYICYMFEGGETRIKTLNECLSCMQLDINKTRHGNLRQIIAGIVDTKIRHIHTNFDTTSFVSNQISFFF